MFLAAGELALYVAYLDGWHARQRIWPWTTALTGLAVSIAGNIGHIQSVPGHTVILADRLTAAASPVAAFAGLSVPAAFRAGSHMWWRNQSAGMWPSVSRARGVRGWSFPPARRLAR